MKSAPVLLLACWLLAALAAPGGARGQYLRCGGEVVAAGDRKFEVLQKCGEPAQKDTRVVERKVTRLDPERKVLRTYTVTVPEEVWTYNFGPGRLLYFVTFEDGAVVDIDTGGYGR